MCTRKYMHAYISACMHVYLRLSGMDHPACAVSCHCDLAVDQERLSEGRGRIRALQSNAHF